MAVFRSFGATECVVVGMLAALVLNWSSAWGADAEPLVREGQSGRLEYRALANGDTIPDFSSSGYRGGGVAIPVVPVRVTLTPNASGDDGQRINAALKQVSEMPANPNGARGAVLLRKGTYRVAEDIKMFAGTVLRGEGQDVDGTLIIATGTKKRVFIGVGGPDKPMIASLNEKSRQIFTDDYVPVGARQLKVANPRAFRPGDAVLIQRPSTAEWIKVLGMDSIKPRPGDPQATEQWAPGKMDLHFQRTVVAVDQSAVTIDAPVVAAMDAKYGGGSLVSFQPVARITEVGVENLRLDSEYKLGQETKDEDHAVFAVYFSTAMDCWLRKITALHFNHTFESTFSTRRITIEDCAAIDAVAEITGGRRYSFGIGGQQMLVQRCYARNGRHDFMTHNLDAGPNAFVDCLSEICHADSGPHNGWATGILYDNITTDTLYVQDRGFMGTGQGWAGANHVLWNSTAEIICQIPPTANNWAIGCSGTKGRPFIKTRQNSAFESWGTPVVPRSLYFAQLKDRLGEKAVQAIATPEQMAGSMISALRAHFSNEPTYGGKPAESKSPKKKNAK